MHVKFNQGAISYRGVIAHWLPKLLCFSVVSHDFVSNGWNLIKLILNIYDHSVVIHVKFHQCVIRYRGVIAL